MKFHRLVIQALALMALNYHVGSNGGGMMLALAEEAAEEAAAAAEDAVPPAEDPPVEDPPVEDGTKEEEDDDTTPEEYKPPENAENYQFQAEVHRMLDIVINSLYQNNDIFLRELISNASDALDKFRYLTLTEPDKYASDDDAPLKIELDYDSDARTLTIRDTGVGMTHDEMVSNLGTVARSGTTKFLEALKEQGSDNGSGIEQIGQFGVGFYSAFLVADRVSVASKSPLSDQQTVWESRNGESEFHIYPDPRGNTLKRGTEITLHLKEDSKYYAKEHKITELTQHYSEFVVHPIYIKKVTEEEVEDEDAEEDVIDEEKKEGDDDLDVSEGDDEEEKEKPKKMKTVTTETWEEINTKQALWTREAESITDEEYQAFWHQLNENENSDATHWTHFSAEGNINFKALLYMPDEIPPELKSGSVDQFKAGIRLYVRKVLISDSFELMPRYLSFIKGVVDSDDLPLNVNRETLQESKIIAIIKKKMTRKTLDLFKDFSKKKSKKKEDEEKKEDEDEEKEVEEEEEDEGESPYIEWYKKFSTSLKLGLLEDHPNRKRIMKLLRFQTSKSDGKYISLEEYVNDMKEWQTEIYTLAGPDLDTISKSPFLDPFQEKDVDVVFFTEPIDEYAFAQVTDYESTKFTDITRENVKFKDEDEDLVKRREKAYKEKFKPLTKWLKKLYGSSIMRVAISNRLGSSPAIVAASQFGQSANMERILRAQTLTHEGGNHQMSMKVFEINPRHPLVLKLLEGCPDEEESPSEDLVDSAWILHDMAMMSGGYPIADQVAHAKRMTKYMQSQLGVESLTLEPEIDPPEEEEEAPDFDADDMGGINMDDMNFGDMDLGDMDLD